MLTKKNFRHFWQKSSSSTAIDYSPLIPFGMTDFHSHLLPGMDDGSANLGMSLNMLREMRRQNVTSVVATPHYYGDAEYPDEFLLRRSESEKLLANAMKGSKEYPDVYIGAEVAYFDGIGETKDIKKLCIKGTKYILVEMPFGPWSNRMIGDLLGLRQDMDLHPILAHVERYFPFLKRDMLEFLINNNVLIQSNASFFTEKRTQKKALKMLSEFEIRLLGSDSHNMEMRRPDLGDGMLVIKEKMGDEKLRMVSYLGKRVLTGAEKISAE